METEIGKFQGAQSHGQTWDNLDRPLSSRRERNIERHREQERTRTQLVVMAAQRGKAPWGSGRARALLGNGYRLAVMQRSRVAKGIELSLCKKPLTKACS